MGLDFFIVVFTVGETWIIPLMRSMMLISHSGSTVDLSVVRLLRLGRVLRLVKVMHVVPEIYIVVMEAARALRSAFAAILTLLLVVYMFTIVFIQCAPDINVDEDVGIQ